MALLCACSASLLPGCYAGVQSTASIVQSDGIPESGGPPNSTLSYKLHSYEVTGGMAYGDFEFFGGGGFGSQDVNIRSSTQAENHSDTAFRVHAGLSFLVAKNGPIRFRAFGIYGTQAVSLFGADLDINQLKSSLEGGLQVSAVVPSDSFYFEPLFRIGVAAQTGSTDPELYQDAMGGSEFDGLAATASVGINFGLPDGFDD